MTLTARRSPRVLALLLSVMAVSSVWVKPRLRAAEIPPIPGGFLELATSTDTRALFSAADLSALLPARGAFTFPAPYATTGVRLTNAADCGGWGDCVQPVGDPTWAHLSNSSGSNLLYAVVGLARGQGGTGATVFQYNKTTGETVNLGGLFDINDDLALNDASTWYFSGTSPTMFYASIDRVLRRYDVVTHAASTVFDITDVFGDDKEIADVHSSADDRVHSFTVRLTSNAVPTGCGIYREDTAQFSLVPPQGTFLDCRVDRSGQWLLIKEDTSNRIVNLALGTETLLLDANGAAGAVDMGFGGMLAADDHHALPNAIRPWTFGPLTSGPVVYHDLAGQPATFTSISFANARSAALDEQYACGSAVNRTNGPRANEIVCVKLDGSLSTLVVAPVMTDMDAAGGGVNESAKLPNGQLDPTGEYFLWTSNAMGGRLDAFLVRVPSQNLVTPPSDTTAPTVAITAPAQLATVNGNAVPLTATAADNVGVAGVQFKLDGVNLGSEITTSPFGWSWNTNTTTDGVHVLTAVARDAAGNTTVSIPVSVTVLNTPTAPAISAVTAFGIKQFRAFVSWHTNQLADGYVEYGLTTGYGNTTPVNAALTTSHLQLLTGLSTGTTYHYRVTSKNAQGTTTTSGDFTFTTATALTITGVGASITSSSVVIAWNTNLASSSQVEYGLTTDYGDATDFHELLVTTHTEPMPSLSPDTAYHYRVYSVSESGALAVSPDFTFHTLAVAGAGDAPGGILETAVSTMTRPLLSATTLQALIPLRGAFTLPAPYGTTAVRITTDADCATADCVRAPGAAHWRNMSNSAGSDLMYIVLGLDRVHGGAGATVFRFNKATQEIVNLGPLFDAGDDLTFSDADGWYFSSTQPTAYYVSIDRQLRRYDVVTRTFSTVFDITAQFGADKEILSAHSSRNDLAHSFTLRYAATGAPIGCGVYREDTQSFSLYPPQGTFHECQVDQTGMWLLIKEDQDGLGGEDNRLIDLTTGTATSLLDAQGAGGVSDLGFGLMLAADDHNVFPNAIRPWTFGPLLASPVVYHDVAGQPSTFTTISFANARSAPLDQQYACGSAVNRTNGPRANEIVCVRLDGSLSTLVVAPVMTDLDAPGGGDDDAAKAPNGNLDPSGEYFLWTSNVMGGRLDAFLVRVPSQILVTPPADITAPTVAITAPTAAGTVSGDGAPLTATAADDNLAGVQFKLDGVNLGAELTSAPYSWLWNTTTTPDGVHVLTAVARDAAGNTTVSEPVTVTVLNGGGAPQISGVAASMISTTTALVSWNTNQLADSQIEFGLTTTYGSSTALNASVVSAHLQLISGLSPNTTYHYRVLSRNAQSVVGSSGDLTLTTSGSVAISGVGPTGAAGFSAVIGWTTNLAATSQVEYGLTTAYGDATEVNSALTTSHAETINGLALGTTYHYRVYSVAANGTEAVSGDFTFTTSNYPVISNIGTSGLTASRATISWTTDELTSSTLEYGLTAAYGSTAGNGSGVTSHSVALSGLTPATTYHFRVSSTNAAGLTTTAADLTFTTGARPIISDIAVTMDTPIGAAISWNTDQQTTSALEYGLTTAYGSTSSNGSLILAHSQTLTGLAASTTYHYRIAASDADGVTTQSTDHTFTTLGAPIISAVTYVIATAHMTWTTDQQATSQVEWGLTTSYGLSTTFDPTPTKQHDQELTSLNPGATYHFRLTSVGITGLTTVTPDMTFTTGVRPAITNIAVTNLSGHGATIQWTTDQLTDTWIEYGLTTDYGATVLDSTLVTAHSQTLTGLTAGQQYFFRVRSTTATGLTTTIGGLSFSLALTLGNVTTSGITDTAATIAWTTNMPANTVVEYGPTTAYGSTSSDATPAVSHSRVLTGLVLGTPYHFRVRSTNDAAITTTSADMTFTTASPPAISAVTYVKATGRVTWATDQPASSQVEWGLTATYTQTTSVPGMATAHDLPLFPLEPGTTYHYRVTSTNAIGLTTTTADLTFTTGVLPILSNIAVTALTPVSATIDWNTDKPTTSVIEYGLTTAYGSANTSGLLISAHSQTLTGLAAATSYHYRIVSSDVDGVTAYSADQTFTTWGAPIISAVTYVIPAAHLTWSTDQPATSQVEWGLTTSYGQSTTFDPALTAQHDQAILGLEPGTTYHFRVTSIGMSGLTTVTPDMTFTTGVRPIITNITATNITSHDATIQWTTDQLADSWIEYGLTTNYGTITTLDPTLVTAHSQTLTGLQSNKTYHYRVISMNADGLDRVSADQAFTTNNGPDASAAPPSPADVPESSRRE